MKKPFAAIILAAGKGKRMMSDRPKVLHLINGKPLIRNLMESVARVPFEKTVIVVGFRGEQVIEELKDFQGEFVWQEQQNGTGHAVMMAEEHFADFDGTVLVANGDVPFLSAESMIKLHAFHTDREAAVTCLTAEVPDPTGYGRIVREPGTDTLIKIVEEKDADPATKRIGEINSGMFCFNSRDLFWSLRFVRDNNAQKELYLTDTVSILGKAGKKCLAWKVSDPLEVEGVNSLEQLKSLEAAYRQR